MKGKPVRHNSIMNMHMHVTIAQRRQVKQAIMLLDERIELYANEQYKLTNISCRKQLNKQLQLIQATKLLF